MMYPVASVTQEGSGSAALNRILSQMHGLWLWQRRRSELRWFWMFVDVPTGRFDVPTARLTTWTRVEAQEVPKEAGKVVASEDESEARFLGQGLGTQNILSKSHL